MKIHRFNALGVHGYLTFKVDFFDDLTFLTGINGGGKTTVIQSIIALITPSFFVLSNLQYRQIEVEITHNGRKLTITALRQNNKVFLSTSETDQNLEILPFSASSEETSFQARESEAQYYENQLATLRDHPVLKVIDDLPTPMFLDLDRRARALQSQRSGRVIPLPPIARRGRNIFSFFLSTSIQLATGMTERRYKEVLIAIGRLSEELRQQMVLDLVEPETGGGFGPLTKPTKKDLETLSHMRLSVATLPQILNVSKQEIEKRLTPALDRLESYAKAIPQNKTAHELLAENVESPGFKALVGWSSSKAQLSKLVRIVERVTDFNK